MPADIISPTSRAVIHKYLALPVGAHPSCPYFNNKRKKNRGGLRVTKGKGSPEEIAEEARIEALQARIDIDSLPADKLKEFLVKRNLGIDCSGFAYHVLSPKGLVIERKGLFGKILARLRPAENVSVLTFADSRNSKAIPVAEAKPGDIITFLGTGPEKTYNHILVITAVDDIDGAKRISYAHSYAWPSDGAFDHGVREGQILVTTNNILAGTWKEREKVGTDNYTYTSATEAREVSVRRLFVL
jgi:hypothetical protein